MKNNSTSVIPSVNKNQNDEQLWRSRRWNFLLISLSLALFVMTDHLERMGAVHFLRNTVMPFLVRQLGALAGNYISLLIAWAFVATIYFTTTALIMVVLIVIWSAGSKE